MKAYHCFLSLKGTKKKKAFFFLTVLGIFIGFSCCLIRHNSKNLNYDAKEKNKIEFEDFYLDTNLILNKNGLKKNSFNSPSDLAVDGTGNIYIVDRGKNEIFVYSSNGDFIRKIGNQRNDRKIFYSIYHLTIDDGNNLYISDYQKKQRTGWIKTLSKEGNLLNSFECGIIPGQVIINKKNIYLSDRTSSNDYKVYKFLDNGNIISGFGKVERKSNSKFDQIYNKVSISSDKKGNIYLAYVFSPKVEKYSPNGELLLKFEFKPSIKNKKQPIEIETVPHEITGESEKKASIRVGKKTKEYPVCFDIAIDQQGTIYSLIPSDHSKRERCSLYCFDQFGKFLEKTEIPFYSKNIFIDSKNNFYFISPEVDRSVIRARKICKDKKEEIIKPEDMKEEKIIRDERYQAILPLILKKSAEYCKRLESSLLDFICEEEIVERVDTYLDLIQQLPIENDFNLRSTIPREVKNKYLYDYQLIRKNNKIKETRILLKENGKKKNIKNAKLKTSAFAYENLVFAPLIFSESWQKYHKYEIIGEQMFNTKNAIVIKVTPVSSEMKKFIYGKFWVDKEDFSILRIEGNQNFLGDFYKIEERAFKYKREPLVTIVLDYNIEKNKIRFPSEFLFEESYVNKYNKKFKRSVIKVVYKNYKFFTVETKYSIK